MNILLKKQRVSGFTLVEIAVVLVILALLAAFFASNLWRSKEDAQVSTVIQWFMSDLPRAIGGYQARTGSLTGITAAELVSRGLNDKTEWGETWTLTVADNLTSARVVYPITYPNNKATIRKDIEKSLKRVADKAGSIIMSATDDGNNIVVVIRGS